MTIRLDGPPIGKGRPRFGRAGAFVRVWTPKKTVDYENLLKAAGRSAMRGLTVRLGAVSCAIIAEMPIPASWSQKKRQAAIAGDLAHTFRPDVDNICKAVFDSLNKTVFNDDSQIVSCSFQKYYSETPGLTVKVWDWT